MAKLPEIPSEYLEPYLTRYFSSVISSVGFGFITPQEGKMRLRGVESFTSQFGGIHSRLACSNEYYKIDALEDDVFKKTCEEVVNTSTPADWDDYL